MTIVGHQTRRVCDIELLGRYRVFTMHLVPSGMHRFFRLPMTELTNASIDAAELFGPPVRELHERLRAAATFAQRVALAERFVLARCDTLQAWSALDVSKHRGAPPQLNR